MKNETIILIVAFVGILYLMFHHNTMTGSTPTNVSPASVLGSGGGSTYYAPTPLQLTNQNAPPTPSGRTPVCTGGSCGGVSPSSYPAPPVYKPPIVSVSQMTAPKYFSWQSGTGKALIL